MTYAGDVGNVFKIQRIERLITNEHRKQIRCQKFYQKSELHMKLP